MAPLYCDGKPSVAATKHGQQHPRRAKGTSFFAFFFSIFVYISIFYAFDLSPSSFLNNNKFWFFISNTLILIIAADYGAFSSSKNKHDLYEDYVMNSQARSVSSFVSNYPEIAKKNSTSPDPPKEESESFPKNPKQIITNAHDDDQKDEQTREKRLKIVVRSEPEKLTENHHHRNMKNYRRTKSEKPRRVVIAESKNIIRRWNSETENEDHHHQEPASAEENEFSNMSDEELNRRVEEFIQKFNRQIRLQRAGNFR